MKKENIEFLIGTLKGQLIGIQIMAPDNLKEIINDALNNASKLESIIYNQNYDEKEGEIK